MIIVRFRKAPRRASLGLVACWLALALLGSQTTAAPPGRLTIAVVDAETKRPIAARMRLQRAQGRPVKPPRVPYWKGWFPLDGKMTFRLRPGAYQFVLERGPEYKVVRGHFEIRKFADDQKTVTMHRFVDMAAEGWWSGDLHVHRRLGDIQRLMRADDLHVAPVITWWNAQGRNVVTKDVHAPVVRFDGNRYTTGLAGEDERRGGALLYFHLPKPLDMTGSTPDYPSSMKFLRQARHWAATSPPGPAPLHVDAEKPFWWDVPLWLASGMVDSMGLANNHMLHDGVIGNEAWGKPRDPQRFPGPLGNGRWSQRIYYRVLDCGLRIPPSAGSASGVLANPIGYDRVYVYCGDQLDYADWWRNLRAGKTFVTNGPLLIPLVNGQLPGHVFRADAGAPVRLDIALKLWTRDPIEYLEVIKNGAVCQQARLDDWTRRGGKLPPVRFDRSGWLLVRAVTTNPTTYRFASTGPYYVEIDGQKRISRRATQWFVHWIDQRVAAIQKKPFAGRAEVLKEFHIARSFWQDLAGRANAD